MSNKVNRLKELLFDSEARALSDLAQRVETVARDGQRRHDDLVRDIERRSETERRLGAELSHRIDIALDRTGTDERLRNSVAAIIDGAIAQAETTRHDQLAQAIAPLVVRTVRTEIRNSQDTLVEALYPMTGRMVKAYVASAMKDLVADINRRLESNALMLRLRSLATGQSVGELALAESHRLDVEELFLIRRGTGEMVDHWPETVGTRDQVVSGILAAINDFATEAFQAEGSALRKVDLEGSQVYLRASPEYLLAVRCAGLAPRAVEKAIDDEFLSTIEHHHAELVAYAPGAMPDARSGALLSELSKRLETRIEEKRSELLAPPFGIRPLPLAAGLLALVIVATAGWYGWQAFETSHVRSVAQHTIESSPEVRGYHLTLDVEPWGRRLTISGLTPTGAAHEDVVARLRRLLPATEIVDRLAVVPEGAPDTRPEIARLDRDVARMHAEAERAAVRRMLDHAVRRLETTVPDLETLRETHPEATTEALATLKSSAARLTAVRQVLSKPSSVEPATVANIAAVSQDLANSGAELTQLLGENARPRVSVQSGPRGSLADAANDVAAETERLAAIVIAVSQADIVNRKPVPPPVIIREAAPPPPPPPPPPVPYQPSPRDRLLSWLPTHAIFFSNETAFRQPERASKTLDELAALLKQTDLVLRIVGFTDEAGGPARNNPLSQQRANRVFEELTQRGVPASRLTAIGRAQHGDISAATGPQSPNRRVEFELAFEGETE